jgi:1-deoxy-D-xylulose-5-phosphate synthase
MLNLPVILAIDRAGLVGEDGETHHGIYDVGFLRHAPGMKILCPASLSESQDMLNWAVKEKAGPVAIRYPRGGNGAYVDSAWDPEQTVCVHREGNDLTILTYGTMVNQAMAAADILEEHNIHCTVLRLLSVAPIPADAVLKNMSKTKKMFVVEEIAGNCAIRESLVENLRKECEDICVCGVDLGSRYIPHGSVNKLYEQYGLNAESIASTIMEVYGGEN